MEHLLRYSKNFLTTRFAIAISLLFVPFLTHSQTNQEKAKDYIDNLINTNNNLFAYSKGNFAVSDDGTMNYEVPIVCVQGTAGMTPKISLVYNSNNGSGIVGEGWSLSGLSVITRTNQNFSIDGKNGRIEFNENDRLVLDGQRLINEDGHSINYWSNALRQSVDYFTEHNSFKRITSYFTNTAVSRFEVRTKDGLIYYYGAIGDRKSDIDNGFYLKSSDNEEILSWLLVRIEDRNQNVIDFEYDKIALAKAFIKPTLIKYTGKKTIPESHFAQIKFNYEKVQSLYKYINGQKIQFDEIMRSIVCEYKDADSPPNSIIRIYKLDYRALPEQNKYFLSSVQECIDNSDCLTTKFVWQTPVKEAILKDSPIRSTAGKTITEDYQIYTGDFNGDGLLDHVSLKTFPDKVKFLFRRNLKGTFAPAVEFEFPSNIGSDSRVLISDFDANGTSDIAFCWIKDNKVNFQIAYTTQRLNGDEVITPNLGKTITTSIDKSIKKNDIFYSSNDFNGDGLQDIYCYYYLKQSIKFLFGINSITKDFSIKPAKVLSTIFKNAGVNDTIPNNLPINLADYNSDGIPDLLFTWINKQGWNTKIYLLNDNLIPQERRSKIINSEQNRFLPLNLSQFETRRSKETIDSTKVELDSVISVKISSFNLFKNELLPITKAVYSLDINHDGNSDLLVSNQNDKGWKTWALIGKGNGEFEEPKESSVDIVDYKYAIAQSFGDFNGDGQVDIVITFSNENGWFAKITYGDGDGRFANSSKTLKLDASDFSYTTLQRIKGMLNIDRFVKSFPEVSISRLKKQNNNEEVPNSLLNNLDETAVFFANKMWSNQIIPTSSFGLNDEEYFNNFTFNDKPKEVGDDVVTYKRIQSISLSPTSSKNNISRNRLHSINSSGDPLVYQDMENKVVNEYAEVKFIDYWKPIIADINGDGVTDFALTYSRQPETVAGSAPNILDGEWQTLISLNGAKKTGMIEKITLGNGADIKIGYSNTTQLGGFDSKTLPISYPNVPYNMSLNVVNSTTSPDGLGGFNKTTYEYKNPIFGITGRGFLGFTKTSSHTEVSGYTTYKENLTDSSFLYKGLLPLKSVEIKVNGTLINQELYNNKIFSDLDGKLVFNYIENKSTRTYDLNKKLLSANESNFEYDRFGNLIKSETKYPTGQIDLISNEYFETSSDEDDQILKRDNLSRWIIGRLKRTTIHKSKGSEEQTTRKSEFDYFQITGQLRTEKTLVGTQYEVNKNYYYDDRGNKIKEEAIADKNQAEVITTAYEFDARYHQRFLTKKVDALNYVVAYRPNNVFGFNEETIDHDGNITRLDFHSGNYDPFGRKQKTILPDGNWQYESNYKCENCGIPNAIYFNVKTTSISATPTITFYDLLDRPLKTINFDTNYNRISKDETYNKKGELIAASTPYFDDRTPSAPVFSTTIEYDELGRTTKMRNPDGTINRMIYDGLKTILINNKGQRSAIINDLFGRKEIQIDNLNNSVTTAYNLDGNVTEITDQTGRKFTSKYDQDLGKVISTYNPNSGHPTTYSYNQWGEVESVKSGYLGGNITSFSYDKIGRVKTRIEKKNILPSSVSAPGNKLEDKIDYDYVQSDDAMSGKGKLKKIRVNGDDRKLNKSFEYDNFGRLISKSFEFENYVGGIYQDSELKTAWNNVIGNGKLIKVRYSYSKEGQIESILYPKLITNNYKKEFLVRYAYQNGTVKTVWANGKKIWENLEENADGTQKQVAYNENKTITDYKYNALNQNLESSTTFYNNNIKIQKWNYEYDDLNNVKYRVDAFNSPTFGETYNYDELNRIKTVQNNNVVTSYRYDQLGNIIYRSDLGYYRERLIYKPNESSRERKLTINRDSLNSIKDDEGRSGDFDDIEYYYDEVGNRYKKELKEKVQFLITFNHFNKSDHIEDQINKTNTSYFYDEENNLQIENKNGVVKYYIDGIFEFEHAPGLRLSQKFYISVNGSIVSFNYIENKTKDDRFFFIHKDHLGSITAITDEKGKPAIFAYDIWGKRLNPKTWSPASNGFTKGFTGHQHWDELSIINMGGRIYDPLIAQFVQVDPVLNLENPTLGLTAYSYCYNSPLYYSDPTGYWSIGGFLGGVARGVVRVFVAGPTASLLVFSSYRDFVDHNAGTIVMVQGIVVSAILTPLGVPPTVTGFATGFASSFAQTFLNGGSFGQALEAGMISGTISGVTAGITSGIGLTFMGADGSGTAGAFGNNYWANLGGKAVSHAVFQGVMNEAQGGSFKDGAIAAFASAASSHYIGQIEGNNISSSVQRTAIAATVGGTTSVIGGGKFGNGAMTAAIVHMYNFEATKAYWMYLNGRGATYNLTPEEFNSLKDDPNVVANGAKRTDGNLVNEPVSFYKSPTNANSAGYATFCLDSKGNRVGYFDLWNLDSKPWGVRPLGREVLVRGGAALGGTPYNVQYNGCTQVK